MNTVLTIAGSDCSGGAGIQADLKTFTAHNVYGISAITSITAQNTTGVYKITDMDIDTINAQLDCIFTDIFPDAIKIGMVSNDNTIKAIASKLKQYNAKNVVVDTVMVSTSGHKLLEPQAIKSLIDNLIPLANIITPNIPEAEVLSNIKITKKDDMLLAAKKISSFYNGFILVKGGHLEHNADDLLYYNNSYKWFSTPKITTNNTHGTGCTLSSAIASNLAKGYNINMSIENAKKYLTNALSYGLNLGKGNGPINHCVTI